MTTTLERSTPRSPEGPEPASRSSRWRHKGLIAAVVLAGWIILGSVLSGIHTLTLPTASNSAFTSWLTEVASSIRGNRTESAAFVYVFNPIRSAIEGFIEVIRSVIAVPGDGNVIPLIGWLGVLAIIGFVVYATSNLRTSLLAMALLFACGALGVWTDTMDTLAMTLGAVFLSLAIGLPLGIWAGLSDRALAAMRPFLDLAQILPTLVYLAPLALVFLIGVASATIATMVYSIPICIRLTSHAIRELRGTGAIEAAISMGSTKAQMLRKVQLPMAKRTIILGVNQTVLAALSFVVIAALIAAPGLGKPIVTALTIRDVGDGVVAGLAVVFLAVMLDRSTTAAVVRSETFVRDEGAARTRRRIGLAIAGVAMIVAVVLSQQVLWAAVFPPALIIGDTVGSIADSAVEWFTSTFTWLTSGFAEFFTVWVLNPLESLLVNSPWWLTVIAISLLGLLIGGRFVALLSVLLLTAIVVIGLWSDTMATLAQVIIATAFTMIIGVVLGVLAGRSQRVERALKPILDAGQTMPAFVYLVPVLALFGPTRFAAIACGVFYAAPVVVRVVADGVRGVPKNMVESATAQGSTTWQLVSKVELPASRRSLMLGVNQGLIFVLAVVVIGGLVGGGGLGYLVLVGQSKPELAGKGLAAGLAIVLLGIVLDRIAQSSGRRR